MDKQFGYRQAGREADDIPIFAGWTLLAALAAPTNRLRLRLTVASNQLGACQVRQDRGHHRRGGSVGGSTSYRHVLAVQRPIARGE